MTAAATARPVQKAGPSLGERDIAHMPATTATSAVRKGGSLKMERCTDTIAGVHRMATPMSAAVLAPTSPMSRATRPTHVTTAARTMMRRPAGIGDTPSAIGTATMVETPGGKCVNGSVVSTVVQLPVGVRYVPNRTKETAPPR